VNRLRTKTHDLFKAVLEDDYDVIVLLETSLVSSFHDEAFSTQGILFSDAISAFLPAPRSLVGAGFLIVVKWIFDVSMPSTKNQSFVEHECVKIKCERFFLYILSVYLASDVGKSLMTLFSSRRLKFAEN
jgi:hypothetical protein